MVRDVFNSFIRAWVQHTGTQIATLGIMAASFTIIALFATIFINLDRILTLWGESIQLTVYLEEGSDAEKISQVQKYLESQDELGNVHFVDKKTAIKTFESQMASYAPNLFSDPYIAEVIPDSFQVSLKSSIPAEKHLSVLQDVAARLKTVEGIEDVTYGQDWVKNYSALVKTTSGVGVALIILLLVSGLFVTGNSIRLAISQRRDEIEVLELVGATHAMIRIPFIGEGAVMGLIASACGLVLSFIVYLWGLEVINLQLTFMGLLPYIHFLGIKYIGLVLVSGLLVGALGALFCVINLNDGWAAVKRIKG